MMQNHAREQAKAQMESIVEMVEELRSAIDADEIDAIENAQQTIDEDPLEIATRTDFDGSKEFMILLCTGGPAVRILGDLCEHGEPENACIQYQDWGTEWTNYPMTQEERESALEYSHNFCFDLLDLR